MFCKLNPMKVNRDTLKEANIYKVINNGLELQNFIIALLESVEIELSGIFSTTRAFYRQKNRSTFSLTQDYEGTQYKSENIGSYEQEY